MRSNDPWSPGRNSLRRLAAATAVAVTMLSAIGCRQFDAGSTTAFSSTTPSGPAAASTNKAPTVARRYSYVPRPYPVDERGFSPVDKALAKAYAREDMVADDAEGSLNPYLLKVISGYPLDGSYQYHCSWDPREYDIYNGVTQDLWYKGMVVAKAYPDGSRCSYCCGFTFEVFVRAMKLRNIQKGLDPDDFNGLTFNDLFNLLQIWYIVRLWRFRTAGHRRLWFWAVGSRTSMRSTRAISSATTRRRRAGTRYSFWIGNATRRTGLSE